jgi:hypothetical protein
MVEQRAAQCMYCTLAAGLKAGLGRGKSLCDFWSHYLAGQTKTKAGQIERENLGFHELMQTAVKNTIFDACQQFPKALYDPIDFQMPARDAGPWQPVTGVRNFTHVHRNPAISNHAGMHRGWISTVMFAATSTP